MRNEHKLLGINDMQYSWLRSDTHEQSPVNASPRRVNDACIDLYNII